MGSSEKKPSKELAHIRGVIDLLDEAKPVNRLIRLPKELWGDVLPPGSPNVVIIGSELAVHISELLDTFAVLLTEMEKHKSPIVKP